MKLLLLVAACGGGSATPDASLDAPPAACTATWDGNLSEVATSTTPCAMVDGAMFTAQVPSTQLDAPLEVSIDLGTTLANGAFASATVPSFEVTGARGVEAKRCTFTAGSAAAPHGDFTLQLADGHGTLAIDLAVLADPFTACGAPLTASVQLAF